MTICSNTLMSTCRLCCLEQLSPFKITKGIGQEDLHLVM